MSDPLYMASPIRDSKTTCACGHPAECMDPPEAREVAVGMVAEFLQGFVRLTARQREAIVLRVNGRSLYQIGMQLRCSLHAADMCIRRALRAWPALRLAFPEMKARKPGSGLHNRGGVKK